MVWIPKESFGSGEVSPAVYGLVSSQQVAAGCQTLTNALITATGSARKRFGTQDLMPATSGFPAAIFSYYAQDRQYVVQIVSQDDDANDLNSANRRMQVVDAQTRALVNFGDNAAHGPFNAFGDTTSYFHHFLASELRDIYAFQDGRRIVFCHQNHPPLFLERSITNSVEVWKYGVLGTYSPARIVDNAVPVQVAAILDGSNNTIKISASSPLFEKADENATWRIGGGALNSTTHPMGHYVRSTRFVSPTEMDAAALYGQYGGDATDWSGPYKETTIGAGSATISSTSSTTNDIRTFTGVTNFSMSANHAGSLASIGGSVWLIQSVVSGTSFIAKRIEGSTPLSGSLALFLMAVGWDTNIGATRRSWFKRQPIYFSSTSGTATITSIEPIFTGGIGLNKPWLPDGHETTFDDIGVAIGGAVLAPSGSAAITSRTVTGGPGSDEPLYTARILKSIPYDGPVLNWGLGWSHGVGFPRCGVAHQNRLFFGGFASEPLAIVASRVFSPDTLTAGPLDDDALRFGITDPNGGVPTWMESSADLLIGTTTGEFAIAGTPLTASNVGAERQTGYGSHNVRPALVGGAALFASGNGLREMAFVFDRDGYLSPDLAEIAKHLFRGKRVEKISYCSNPLQTVYVLVRDTTTLVRSLYLLSYWRENGIVGWSTTTQPAYPKTAGTESDTSTIESITTVRAGGTILTDELWLVRRYFIGGESGAGTEIRRIERMTPDFQMDQTFVDSTPSSTQLGPMTHLIDLSQAAYHVQVLLDGVYIGLAPVSIGGLASYADTGTSPTTGQCGRTIRFECVPIVPMPSTRDGATQGRIQNVTEAKILLVQSKGGTIDGARINREAVPAATPTAPIAEVTEWRPVPGIGEHGVMAVLNIVQDVPYHFEVAGLNMQVDTR